MKRLPAIRHRRARAGLQRRRQRAGDQGPARHQPGRQPSADDGRAQVRRAGRAARAAAASRSPCTPAGQLGSDVQMQSALRGGTQEFAVPSTATLAGIVKEFGVIGLPFSFTSVEQADAVLDGPFGKSLLEKLPEKGLVGLAFWENGFRNLTNSKRPVTKVEDIAGLKVRTMQNPVYIDLFNGLGANAVPMAVTELFSALESRRWMRRRTRSPSCMRRSSTTCRSTCRPPRMRTTRWSSPVEEVLGHPERRPTRPRCKPPRPRPPYSAPDQPRAEPSLRAELVKLGMQINDVSDAERQRMREKLQPVIAKHSAAVGEAVTQEFFAALAKAPANEASSRGPTTASIPRPAGCILRRPTGDPMDFIRRDRPRPGAGIHHAAGPHGGRRGDDTAFRPQGRLGHLVAVSRTLSSSRGWSRNGTGGEVEIKGLRIERARQRPGDDDRRARRHDRDHDGRQPELHRPRLQVQRASTCRTCSPTPRTPTAVFDGPVGHQLMEELEEHNMKGLGVLGGGLSHHHQQQGIRADARRPEGPEDPHDAEPAAHRGLQGAGREPVPMPLGELYRRSRPASSTRRSIRSPITLLAKLYEVQKYVTMTRHAYTAHDGGDQQCAGSKRWRRRSRRR